MKSRLLWPLLACWGIAAAATPSLSDADLETLRAWREGWSQAQAAGRIAQRLGRAHDLEAAPLLLQLADAQAMGWYVSAYHDAIGGTPPEAALDAMVLGVVRDPMFFSDDPALWPIRQAFLGILGQGQPQYESRELFQLLYDQALHALTANHAARGSDVRHYWVGDQALVPTPIAGIESADAALLPLLDDACQARWFAVLFKERHDEAAFEPLRDLYLRTGITRYPCTVAIASTFVSFHSEAATEAIAQRLRWLLAQPPSAARDAEIVPTAQAFGSMPAAFQLDRAALGAELAARATDPALRSALQPFFTAQADLARRAHEITAPNFNFWLATRDLALVQRFLGAGADPNTINAQGESALAQVAAPSGADTARGLAPSLAITQALLQAGADVERGSRYGTPLQLAACGRLPLGPEVRDERGAIVALLLAHGARVDERGAGGLTPLQAASRCGNRDVVEALLAGGADVRAAKPPLRLADGRPTTGDIWSGATALHYAADAGEAGIVVALLDHHADLDARTAEGATPLLMAVMRKDRAMVSLLLDRGADVTLATQQGVTPIQTAHDLQDEDIERLLRAHGARLNPITAAEHTLIRWLIELTFLAPGAGRE